MSFLAQTTEVSPDLESLVLYPRDLPQEVLVSCMTFKRLQHLEILDISCSMINTFLNDVGSLVCTPENPSNLISWTEDAQDYGEIEVDQEGYQEYYLSQSTGTLPYLHPN